MDTKYRPPKDVTFRQTAPVLVKLLWISSIIGSLEVAEKKEGKQAIRAAIDEEVRAQLKREGIKWTRSGNLKILIRIGCIIYKFWPSNNLSASEGDVEGDGRPKQKGSYIGGVFKKLVSLF